MSGALLDKPHKPGRGRGAGAHPGTWPYAQMQLFRTLWGRRPADTIADLCNIPVYLWLYWGDDYVPLRQVGKVMNTWLALVRHVPARAADDAAAHILGIIAEGRPTRARRDLLAQALKAEPIDVEQARSQLVTRSRAMAPVVDPASGRTVDVDPELLARFVEGRAAAEKQLGKLPDYLFEWARFFNLYTEGEYQRDQPVLAADSRHGRLFPRRHVEDTIKRACANLLTLLGAALAIPIDPLHVGTPLDPNEWKSGRLHGRIRDAEMKDGGLAVEFEIFSDYRVGSPKVAATRR